MSWMTVYNWPVFKCPQLAGFGCPPRPKGPAQAEGLPHNFCRIVSLSEN